MLAANDSFISNMTVLIKSSTVVALWAAFSASFGVFFLDKIMGKEARGRNDLNYWTAGFLIGMSFTIFSSLFLMSTMGLSKGGAFLILAVFILVGIFKIRELIKYLGELTLLIREGLKQNRFLTIACILLIVGIMLVILMSSLLPPKFEDELAYHVWNPQNGRYFLENPVYGNTIMWPMWFPRNLETIYFFFRILSGDFIAAKIFQILLLILTFLTIARHFLYYLKSIQFALLLAITCVLAFRFLYSLAPTLLIDSGIHSLILIGGISFINWATGNAGKMALLNAGLAMGLALGSKYSSIYYFVALFIIFLPLFLKIFTREKKEAFKVYLLLIGPALFGCGYWYLRNFFLSGNPFYPFIFGHPGFTNVEINELNQIVASLGIQIKLADIWRILLTEIESYKSFLFIPIFFSLGAFIFPKYRKPALILGGLILSIIILAVQGTQSIYPRYHIAVFIMGSLFGSYVLAGLLETNGVWRNIALSILVCVLGGYLFIFSLIMKPVQVFSNLMGNIPAAEKYLAPSLAALEVNSMERGQEFKILNIYPDHFFLFYRPLDRDITLNYKELSQNKDFDSKADGEILEMIISKGVTHFLTDNNEIFSLKLSFRTTLEEFLRISRIRSILINNSKEIQIHSNPNKKLYKFIIPIKLPIA